MDGIEKDLPSIRPSNMAQKSVGLANQGYGVVDTVGAYRSWLKSWTALQI
jgi:hypothetical protein